MEYCPLADVPVPIALDASPSARLPLRSLKIKELVPAPSFIGASPSSLGAVHIAIFPVVPCPVNTEELSILSQKTFPAISSEIIAQSPGSQSVIVPPAASGKGVVPATDTTQYLPV